MAVFVVHPINNSDINLERHVEQWGHVRYVNQHYVTADRLDGERLPKEFARALRDAASQFQPGFDYLLIAGDHLQIVAFSAMLAARFPFFRVLRWDRQAVGYYPVEITNY